jgi:hypothetical protein
MYSIAEMAGEKYTPNTKNFLRHPIGETKMNRAYLIYPFSIYGSEWVKNFKEMLKREGKEILDPFEIVGVGTTPDIAEKDLNLIKECEEVIAFLPIEGTQSGMELILSLNLGKKITIYTQLNGPFLEWLKLHGVEVIYGPSTHTLMTKAYWARKPPKEIPCPYCGSMHKARRTAERRCRLCGKKFIVLYYTGEAKPYLGS